MPEPLLDIRGVTKRFELADRTVTALSDAHATVVEGEIVCLLGPSGCGKSTLLRTVAGLEDPSEGDIRFMGEPVTGPGAERGMVFQDYALFPWLDVRANVAFGPRANGSSKRTANQIADRYLEMVGLADFAGVWPHQLSGGMRQRVAIARVLANNSKLVLMDEPFGALDAMTRERLQKELLSICDLTGLTVLFVTHSIEEAVLLGSRVIVMASGPGRIVSDRAVDLAYPRDPTAPDFNLVRRGLTEALHGQAAPAVQATRLQHANGSS